MSFLDASEGSVPEILEAHVCIIGAGAAGITIANELGLKQGVDVLLLESGDMQLDGDVQSLYAGKNVGAPYYDLASCRLRYFGGTTNHWGGYCRANDPINYEGRPDLDVPSWPFGFEEATPWVKRAAETLGIDSRFFEPQQLLANEGFDASELLERLGKDVFVAVNQITAAKRFSERFAPELESTSSVRVVTNINLVGIRLNENGESVRHLDCQTLGGSFVKVKADVFVLACHAIENARLMLVSNDVASSGIGNDHDLVGRYFAEHPQVNSGLMIAGPRFPDYFDRRYRRPETHLAAMSLNANAMRNAGALSYHMHFASEPPREAARRAARRLIDGLWKPFATQMLLDSIRVFEDITAIARPTPGPLHPNLDGTGDRILRLNHTFEQAPNRDSRVRLSTTERDALNIPRVELDWQLNEQDLRTLREGQRIVAAELSAIGFGRFALEEFEWSSIEGRVNGHYHHYGTTRMSTDPRSGVVNSDQRVHGVANLFVAGSSVFPTAAAHGPTLHIVAFSLRLADYLLRNINR